jgi:divalent metal cation (Fe/Co/Zn/Cd) transporter
MKIIASVLSNSLSIISSVIDSAVDLVSSIILFWTARAIRNRNHYKYPAGRARLEPVAIIILSVIMCSASVQVLSEAMKRLIAYIQYIANYSKEMPEVNMNIKQPFPIIVMCITIGMNKPLKVVQMIRRS